MKKIDYEDYLFLNNYLDSSEQFLPDSIKDSPDIDEFMKNVEAPNVKDSDIQSFIQKLNDLPCCLNEFLEKIINTPKGLFQLLEIRKRNIKIKMHTSEPFDNKIFCKWCNDKCQKLGNFQEKEINFAETNSKICSCAIENHDISKQNTNLGSISNDEKEINELIDLAKSFTAEKKELIKEKFLNLIKGEDNDRILQIFSYLLSIYETHSFFYSLDYNDNLYSEMLSCIKKNQNYSKFNNILINYMEIYFFNKVMLENPIYNPNLNYSFRNTYAIYYYNPDIFSYSFFFQVYRKKIISKNIESDECISFLRKSGIRNDILCPNMMNEIRQLPEFYSFGFFSLDSITKVNAKELTKFKQFLSCTDIILIQTCQFCEIF